MDETEYFEGLLHSLRKPQSGKRLLQVLIALRKQVNTPNHHSRIQSIKERNCLKPLVGYIRYDGNLKVVDLALSVLGNCCMNQAVVKQTINELNILHNLNRVLDKHKKDSIQGRVFRILGNLCDHYEPLQIIKKEPAVVDNVIQFLKTFSIDEPHPQHVHCITDETDVSKTSIPTVSMAIRFIRKIVKRETFDLLVTKHLLLKTIGLVLIKCSDDWMTNQKEEVLINDVLKIVQIISSSVYSDYDVIFELKNTEKGDALNSLGDIILLQTDKITKIILKLAKVVKHQSDLPIEAIITNLLNAVKINREKPNILHRQYLQCINNLMDHIGFHNKLQNSNNIELLVKLLQNFDANNDFSVHCCIYICSTLNKCKYNEGLVKLQLSADIISVITDKLEVVSGYPGNKISVDGHEMKNSGAPYQENIKRFKKNGIDDDKTITNYDLNKSVDRCVSPSLCSDISSCGPFSPMTSVNLCNDSDSDNYSPLCSESEGEDEFKESIPEDDLISSESEENRPILNADQLELRYRLCEEMHSLLKMYCYMEPLHQQLGNPRLLTVLMNIVLNAAVSDQKCDTAFLVILSIARTRDFLIPLMVSGFITQVYEVMETKHGKCCTDCEILQSKTEELISKFLTVGKSESIKGDIAHLLLSKGKEEIKEKLALSIPYVIRDPAVLNKLMMDCGSLNILIKLLKNQNNIVVQEKALRAICTLATDSLKIKNPVNKKLKQNRKQPRPVNITRSPSSRIKISTYKLPDPCKNIVTFNLDDGSCVKADRDALNEKSDYFCTLLSGRFMESEQNEITLHNVTQEALSCLLQLLKLNVKLTMSLEFDFDLETVLDVISLSDRFLLTELNYILVCHVEQLITKITVPKFYKWAIESGTNIMRIESVAFALVGDIPYKERLDMFHTLFNLGYFFELIDDVEKLIIQFL